MKVEVLADGLGFTEGPVALPDGRIALTSISEGCVFTVDPSTATVERIDVGGGPNGLALGPGGELYVAQNGGAWGGSGVAPAGVQVIDNGRVEYLVEGLGAPNDLAIGADGRLWVTDTVAEFPWGEPDQARPGQVFAIDLGTGTASLMLEEGPLFLNGLAFSQGGAELLVTATITAEVLAYTVTPHLLVDPRRVITFEAPANPDGIARIEDRYWVALLGADRLDLIDSGGATIASQQLPVGTLPTNVCADHDGAGLYVTGGFAQALLHLAGESLNPKEGC
ncbi:MAG: hypothetical protein JWP74_2512 [Marmoricola sp.]|nr:hypothetical protein [Marmoricola sp.]